jgi:murein DD-endopeptidase MepM/ murein hydrolase activator NlpD
MYLSKRNLKCYISLLSLICAISLLTDNANAQHGLELENDTLSQTVLIHPVIETAEDQYISTREHTYRSHLGKGDQLGRDFMVASTNRYGIIEIYKNEGRSNEDYFGWNKNVMAPMDAEVTRVNEADSTNNPGNMNGNIEPGIIAFQKDNGLTVLYVHVKNINVEKGDRVDAGDIVAKVGNNGRSIAPHVHVGAWKDDTPLQIQVDLYAKHRSADHKKH